MGCGSANAREPENSKTQAAASRPAGTAPGPAAAAAAPAPAPKPGEHHEGEEEVRRVYNKETGQYEEAKERKERKEVIKYLIFEQDEDLFAEQKEGNGEQFMACKPWIGAVVAPTKPPANNGAIPDVNYKLDYVFGYRTYECRNNL